MATNAKDLFVQVVLVDKSGVEETSLFVVREIGVMPFDDTVTPDIVQLRKNKEYNVSNAKTDKTLVRSVVCRHISL